MPEGRAFPWKYLPRLGVKLSVTFGEPLPPEDIQAALRAMGLEDVQRKSDPTVAPSKDIISKGARARDETGINANDKLFGVTNLERVREGVTREAVGMNLETESRKRQLDHTRSLVTAVVQRAVEQLGRRVSGDDLGKSEIHNV